MPRPLVGVVLSTRSEYEIVREGLDVLRELGVPFVVEAFGAQEAPERLEKFALESAKNGLEVFIAACSGTSLLATHLAVLTKVPVIGLPIGVPPLHGQDSLAALAMVPPGLSIATVGINNAVNAALVVAQFLAMKHPEFRVALDARTANSGAFLDALRRELASEYPPSSPKVETPAITMPPAEPPARVLLSRTEAITPAPSDTFSASPAAKRAPLPTPSALKAAAPARHDIPHEPAPSSASIARLAADKPKAVPPPRPVSTRTETAELLAISPPPATRRPTKLPVTQPRTLPRVAAALYREPEQREMRTKVFRVDRQHLGSDLLDHVMMVLLEGGIVAIPTDTVYGLAAIASNRAAVERLCRVKGALHRSTLGVLIHDASLLPQVACDVPRALEAVIDECWPGALSIILQRHPELLAGISRSDRIGVRVPADPLCLEVIARVGHPVVTRNASIDPNEPMTSADEVVRQYDGHIDCILDAGDCSGGAGASTVLSAIGEPFQILREGAVRREVLERLLGDKLRQAEATSAS